MIRPERLPYAPVPTIAPDRIWTKPMKVLPGAVPQPVQQNVWAPLVSGITSAVGSIGNIYQANYMANKPSTASTLFNQPLNTNSIVANSYGYGGR